MPKKRINYRNVAHQIASRRGGLDTKRGIRNNKLFDLNNVHTNLQAPVGIFRCEVNSFPGCGTGVNGTYVGKMHYHPDNGFMAGAEHSEENHPNLIIVENR